MTRKQIHIILTICFFLLSVIFGLIDYFYDHPVWRVFLTVSTSLLASCLYSITYGAIVKDVEIEEITNRTAARINSAYPQKIYKASDDQSDEFPDDLSRELVKCKHYYWYEGDSLITANKCIKALFKSKDKSSYAQIALFLPNLNLLNADDGANLIKSIVSIYNEYRKNGRHEFRIYVLSHHSHFHIHMTENMVMYSPFKGQVKYPTTYKYNHDSDGNSYYHNIKSRLDKLTKEAEDSRETNVICIKVNNHKKNRDEVLKKILNALNFTEFLNKAQQELSDVDLLELSAIDSVIKELMK